MSTPPGRTQSQVGDPYAVLGVARGASRREIAEAYRRLAKRHHPDVDPDPSAAIRMRRINAAWRSLSDPRAERDAAHETSSAHWTSAHAAPRRARGATTGSWAAWDSRGGDSRGFDPRRGPVGRPIPGLRQPPPRPVPTDSRFEDSGVAALLAAGVMLVLLFAAAFAGGLSSSSQVM